MRFGGRGLTDQSSLVQIASFASWEFHQAWLRSNSGMGASAMITAARTGGAFQMGPDVYRTITRSKIGLPKDSDLRDFCRCGHPLSPHARHLATCYHNPNFSICRHVYITQDIESACIKVTLRILFSNGSCVGGKLTQHTCIPEIRSP